MGSAAEGTAVPTAVPTEGAEGLPPPAPRLEDWPVEDDFMLRESVEAGAALPAIARGILPFSKPYTLEDITNRWRALLYSPDVARRAGRRMALYTIEKKPRVRPVPCPFEDFRDAYAARQAAATSAVTSAAPNPPVTRGPGAPAGSGTSAVAPGGDEHGAGREAMRQTVPRFTEAEQCVLDLPSRPVRAQVDPAERKRSRGALAAALCKIRRLEASALAATARTATAKGALAVLQGANTRFLVTKRETVLGRSTDDQKVDIDLAEEGNASKVSRQQAFIKLRWNGEFCLRNVGRRPVWINNVAVESGRRCHLAPNSLIEVGNMRLLFLPNPTLVRASAPEPF